MKHTTRVWTAVLASALIFSGSTASIASASGVFPGHWLSTSGDMQVAQLGQVTGTITYRERIALLPDAMISVQLLDVSRADAPAIVISQLDFLASGRQVPFSFTLVYNPASIDPSHQYAVRSTITSAGRLQFTTTRSYPVLTHGQPSHVDMVLNSAGNRPGTNQIATSVNGTVTHLQFIALPDDAVLSVKLLDVTNPGPGITVAPVIAEATMPTNGNQVPFTFSLPVSPAEIDQTHTYAVKAEISYDGRVMFTTAQPPLVLTMGNPSHVDIVLTQPVAPPAAPPATPPSTTLPGLTDSPWVWESSTLADGSVHTPKQPGDTILTLRPDDTMGLRTDCNTFFGGYKVTGNAITFAQMGGTLMACFDESKQDIIVDGISKATSFEITADAKLILTTSDGSTATFVQK